MSGTLFEPSVVQSASFVLDQESLISAATLSSAASINDLVRLGVWNTDHDGIHSEIWYSSDDRDIYAVRAKTGEVTNYIQGDYKLKAYMLYYYDPETTPEPKSLDDVLKNCTLVQSITEADKHYDISGLKWNVSVAFYDRERAVISV